MLYNIFLFYLSNKEQKALSLKERLRPTVKLEFILKIIFEFSQLQWESSIIVFYFIFKRNNQKKYTCFYIFENIHYESEKSYIVEKAHQYDVWCS